VKAVPIGELLVDAVGAVFPLQQTPSIIVSDYAMSFGVGNTDDGDQLKIDGYATGCMPTPIFVPHGQQIYDSSGSGTSIVNDMGDTPELLTWFYDSGGDDPSSGDLPLNFDVGLDNAGDEATVIGDPGSHPPGGDMISIEPNGSWTPSADDQTNFAQIYAPLTGFSQGSGTGGSSDGSGSGGGGFGGPGTPQMRRYRRRSRKSRQAGTPRDTTGGSGGTGGQGDQTENAQAQGVTFFVGWDPASIDGGVPSQCRCNWNLPPYRGQRGQSSSMDPSKGVMFSALLTSGDLPKIQYSVDQGETWKTLVAGVKPSQNESDQYKWTASDTTDDGGYYTVVSVLYLNFTMRVSIGGMTTPVLIEYDIPYSEEPRITEISVQVSNFTYLSAAAHLCKWGTFAWRRSTPINMGEPTNGVLVYRMNGISDAVIRGSYDPWTLAFPYGSQIICGISPGTSSYSQDQQYDLAIYNVPAADASGQPIQWADDYYADLTAVCTRVGIGAPGTWYQLLGPNARALIPKEVQEDWQFDKQNLTLRHTFSFVVDNQHGEWAGAFGESAVSFSVGYADPPVGLTQRFVGKARRYQWERSSASQANLRVYCEDQMGQLEDGYSFSPPDMDGWNIYAAAAYLAQVAGFHASQLAFRFLVPAVDPMSGQETTLGDDWNAMIDPDGVSPADPNYNPMTGEQGYFLPMGFGSKPWTPVDRVSSVMDLLNYIRQPAQALMYFDNYGYFHFEPWIPPVAGVVQAIYTEAPTGPEGANLSEVWNTEVAWDGHDIRNVFRVIGVNSVGGAGGWNPIVTWANDSDSIYSPGVFNYVGYRKPFVQMDSKFANLPFAMSAILNYYRMMRIPGYSAGFEAFMQPGIFPMMSIQLMESKSGVWQNQLYVMAHSLVWTCLGGSMRFRSNIRAEYITPFNFAFPFVANVNYQPALPERSEEPVTWDGILKQHAGKIGGGLSANPKHRPAAAAV
jgi:hypothetical protein